MLTELHPVIEISLLAGIPALVALWGKHTFVSKNDCVREQDRCSAHICKKVDEIKAGQAQLFRHMQKNERLLGRIEQYMEEHRGN